jgi:hypothetical protein
LHPPLIVQREREIRASRRCAGAGCCSQQRANEDGATNPGDDGRAECSMFAANQMKLGILEGTISRSAAAKGDQPTKATDRGAARNGTTGGNCAKG